MRKKLLFVSSSLKIGGAQRSLVNLLNNLDFEKYDIDLFLFSNTGEYINVLNPKVRLINKSKILNILGMTSVESKEKGVFSYLIRKMIATLCLVFGSDFIYNIIFFFVRNLYGYDVAISYLNNVNNRSLYFGVNKFVLKKVKCKKKITWIHSDYIDAKLNNKINNREYHKFDSIINVSRAAKSSFDKTLPVLSNKSYSIYNILPYKSIEEQARLENPFKDIPNYIFKIVTVCRLDKNKSVDVLVNVAYNLLHSEYKFVWFIVGDGPMLNELKLKSTRLGLSKIMFFVGSMKNPYPFMINANLLVSASKSESFGISIAESLLLGTPVLVGEYPAVHDLVINMDNGLIVDNNEEQITKGINFILDNPEIYNNLKLNTKNSKFNNDEQLKTFYKIVEL